MESGAVFVATLSGILLVLLIFSTLRWWRKRMDNLRSDVPQRNRNSINGSDMNDDNWIFSIERGTDRQLIRYSTDDLHFNGGPGLTNCRHYSSERKSVDSKGDDGLPSYEEAIKAQQQHDLKIVNSNAALTGSVV